MKTEQRVIKFRAWDTENKRMVYPDGVFHFIANGKLFKLDPLIREDRYVDMGLDVKIMQFTGLVDKAGVEIYEGDVILFRLAEGLGHPESGVQKQVVKYSPYGFFTPYYKDIRVIGNIYQNPEHSDLLPSTTTI
jgi:hypothetical protein